MNEHQIVNVVMTGIRWMNDNIVRNLSKDFSTNSTAFDRQPLDRFTHSTYDPIARGGLWLVGEYVRLMFGQQLGFILALKFKRSVNWN